MKHWFYSTFKDYVAQKGYSVLRDDYKFIENIIQHMPEIEQREVMRNYLKEWHLGTQKDVTGLKTQNLGRLQANMYLREYAAMKKRGSYARNH